MESFNPHDIERPHPSLMKYYAIMAVVTGPGVLITLPRLFFKYRTLRYRFDDDGMSMSWGILFRQEIHLTYRRIQDIHLSRNIVQRWLGLATVSIQTASGSSGPEASVEGIIEADQLRDYLYEKMRGARGLEDSVETPAHQEDEALRLLVEIRDLIRQKSLS